MTDGIDMEINAAPRTGGADYHELYRPQFHFTARTGWLNDPNGLVYYAGEYHLFFQHNPAGNEWANMHWGHAVSTDLLHWRQLPNAITPDRAGTAFSGSAVVDNENTSGLRSGAESVIAALYTAAGGTSAESAGEPFTQRLAYSNDRGRTWTKYAGNPVLPHIVGENRDPRVIWYAPGRFWVMSLFLDAGSFGLFTSSDLKRWTRIQTLSMDGSECPDFFPISIEGEPGEERWVFVAANGSYVVGTFDGKQFVPEAGERAAKPWTSTALTSATGQFSLDLGGNYYAMQTFSNVPASDGRRIQIAWMAGGVYPDMPFNQQMSIPSVLTLRRLPEGLRLFRYPVAEVESLRTGTREWRQAAVAAGDDPLAGITGDLFDIEMEVDCPAASSFGLKIRGTEIRYDGAAQTLSCLGRTAPFAAIDGCVPLRILVDRASIEIFAGGGRLCMSCCFTPPPPDLSMAFLAEGDGVSVISMDVHTLKSVWPAGDDQ